MVSIVSPSYGRGDVASRVLAKYCSRRERREVEEGRTMALTPALLKTC